MKLFLVLFVGFGLSFVSYAHADEETSGHIPIHMEAPTFTQDTPLSDDTTTDLNSVEPEKDAIPFRDTFPPPKTTAQADKTQNIKLDAQQIMQQESKLLNALIGDSNTDTE